LDAPPPHAPTPLPFSRPVINVALILQLICYINAIHPHIVITGDFGEKEAHHSSISFSWVENLL
jgi:hypothetical protein